MNKKNLVFDIITLVLLSCSLFINLICFLLLFIEQITFGVGTQYEMFILVIWILQIITLPVLFVGIIYIIISLIKKYMNKLIIINIIFQSINIIFIVLTNIFINY